MRTRVIWRIAGKFRSIRWSAFGLLPEISPPKRVASLFGSYLGGGVRQNKSGYLVRDDLPRLSPSVRTVVVRRPGWTSPSGCSLRTS